MHIGDHIHKHLRTSGETKLALAERHAADIERLGRAVAKCLLDGGKILTCGNGGSASDSEHITAEFVGRFRRERRSLASIALTGPSSLITAIANDYGYDQVFGRQVEGQGRRGDILFAISTSGNSQSVINAVTAAKRKSILAVAFTGDSGGKLAAAADLAIRVPSTVTAHIQEAHIAVAHMICEIADELIEQAGEQTGCRAKIRSIDELAEMRPNWRSQGRTVVWTNGCFDILHVGHLRNLRDAKAQGDILVVGINSDRSVRTIKGDSRPIQDENSRAELLAGLEPVDYVTIFDEDTPVAALEKIRPDVHCKGADYADGARPVPERETVEKHGGRVHFLELHPGFSTTALIARAFHSSSQ